MHPTSDREELREWTQGQGWEGGEREERGRLKGEREKQKLGP